ncbi:carboxypeptidase-like regulatory domain-containing protein [Robiginitalea sediminis]|uniref:carboxypeptidase-like regulatory domain-containing protein n=1 Tax=Robiginitalea sediminis TaxID=1982593 RepID=UPI001302EF83|nr:carboxypeptidase-like regulatory domain-containing protein [Robiginitalea sediminis]
MRISLMAFLLFTVQLVSAQARTFTLQDAENAKPIPFATVVTGPGSGTITNEEGIFTIDLSSVSGDLKISCLGYRSLAVAPSDMPPGQNILQLQPAAINLNEVRVGGAIPSADAIVRQVRERLDENHPSSGPGYTIFYRESDHMKFDDLVLELEKASDLNREELREADARLRQLGADIVKANVREYLDFGGVWKAVSDTSSILQVDQAIELVDHSRDFSMDNIQKRAQAIILDHLDTTQTYKMKTGLFKIEDSISPGQEFAEGSEREDSIGTGYLKEKVSRLMAMGGWKDGTRLRSFLDPDAYEYRFLDATYFDGYYVYAIGFEPGKRKSKYSGVLYVEANSFAVLKADYRYARGKGGDKVNLKLLLGIKYEENLSRGTVIFKRNEDNTFFPYYIEIDSGNYVYLHRELKFIENSPARKKVRFDFLLEGRARERESMLVQPVAAGSGASLTAAEEIEKIPLLRPGRFERSVWQDATIIEPLEDMKNFRVEER